MTAGPTPPPGRRAGGTGPVSRVLLRVVVALLAVAGIIMLAMLIEADRGNVPLEVLLPVDEQQIRWTTPMLDAGGIDAQGDGAR